MIDESDIPRLDILFLSNHNIEKQSQNYAQLDWLLLDFQEVSSKKLTPMPMQ